MEMVAELYANKFCKVQTLSAEALENQIETLKGCHLVGYHALEKYGLYLYALTLVGKGMYL